MAGDEGGREGFREGERIQTFRDCVLNLYLHLYLFLLILGIRISEGLYFGSLDEAPDAHDL